MISPHAPTAPRRSHPVTRRELEDLLAPAAPVSLHERQRALVQASLLTRPHSHEPSRHRGGWVPG